MHASGDTPGAGYYSCRNCGKVIYLARDADTLPQCPDCGGTHWAKLT